jgi:hypothetical protein
MPRQQYNTSSTRQENREGVDHQEKEMKSSIITYASGPKK